MMPVKQVIKEIVAAQQTLGDFYPIRRQHVPRPSPPASAAEVDALEKALRVRGLHVPPSYKAFLAASNGFEAFDTRLNLFSAKQVLEPVDASLKSDFPTLSKFVVAGGNTSAFISFDPDTADKTGEMEAVWVAEDGGEFRYPSFGELLQQYRDELQKTVAKEQADRKRLRD
jgi:hypothetical protein